MENMGSVRRAIAVEVESPPPELSAVEEAYRRIVEEVAVYIAERGRLEREKYDELYRRFRELYPWLHSQLVQQAMNQGVEVGKSFLQRKKDGRTHKPRPEVRRVAIRFAKDSWSYRKAAASIAPIRLELQLFGRGVKRQRYELWIKPHRRFWLYWWKALRGEAELASTLMLKRRRGRFYAIFMFDVKTRKEPPAEVVAFDINENTVAVARINLLATVDRVASWNRQYTYPAVYSIRTNFGRLAKRYRRIRNAKLEELKRKYPYAGRDDEEKVQNVTDTREYKKFARRLREKRRKEARVRQVARDVMRNPAVIITEELGKNPQEEMIGVKKKKVKKRELRHRIKQIPFRKLVRTVEDKAAEVGSSIFLISSFRNSRVCPIHFAKLEDGGDWHTLWCPHGHEVDRDAAAVLNMLWKITPEGVTRGVWWRSLRGMKLEREELVPEGLTKRKTPLVKIPWPVVYAVWISLRALKAGDKWPAVLARAASMTPARGAYEGGARAPVNRPGGTL